MNIAIPDSNAPDSHFEAFWTKCIQRIARGSNRDVYAIPEHDDKVLKVSNRQGNLPNWSEIALYQSALEKEYFAEIISWSWSGKFIVMERLTPISYNDLIGAQFPDFLSDRKSENFGRATSGNIKALDYALPNLQPGRLFTFPPL
jgi:hypothetical protein